MHIRDLLLPALLLLVAPAQAQIAPSPDSPESAFDFMRGSFLTFGGVALEDGSYESNQGLLTGEDAFIGGDTPSLLVRTMSLPGDNAGNNAFGIMYFEDLTLYAFHAESGQWRGISHNTLGNRKWRDVTVSDGEVSFIQTGELFRGTQGEVRFTYHDISDAGFSMRIDYRAPDTEDWIMGTYRMTAQRQG